MCKCEKAYCQYMSGPTEDAGTEALAIYLPVGGGYVQYMFVHSVIPAKQCNVWRLGPAFLCDGSFTRRFRLTRERAEWEMALRLKDRPDFIGGAAHGDEVGDDVLCRIDGSECSIHSLTALTAFTQLELCVRSVGFDPAAPTEQVLRHYKRFVIHSEQIRVEQRVEWLTDVPLAQSYMAMMPPLKLVTDRYRIGEEEFVPIVCRSLSESGCFDTISLCGNMGLTFTMTVLQYLSRNGGNTCIITDNGGDQYHKMYFVLKHDGQASRGDIWETVTQYSIC